MSIAAPKKSSARDRGAALATGTMPHIRLSDPTRRSKEGLLSGAGGDRLQFPGAGTTARRMSR